VSANILFYTPVPIWGCTIQSNHHFEYQYCCLHRTPTRHRETCICQIHIRLSLSTKRNILS